ncbi:hypothetical protein BDV36DRAFT_69999 [Aspergillus pseudocaelatus]|uniref:Uncharacterized protein n=1 Tax=Aspergillus pseudocaelatus TaxID=1825620 RepID=A0ABQ6W4I9_9EURO|nr:hypothetical protein BDV36DRAFT_69999 [Aspergillus pseudocaelatus]
MFNRCSWNKTWRGKSTGERWDSKLEENKHWCWLHPKHQTEDCFKVYGAVLLQFFFFFPFLIVDAVGCQQAPWPRKEEERISKLRFGVTQP